MHYYIWKKFNEAIKENVEYKRRYKSAKKALHCAIAGVAVFILSAALIAIKMEILKTIIQVVCVILMMLAVCRFFRVNRKIEQTSESDMKWRREIIDILFRITQEFKIDRKEKIEVLIIGYQGYINDQKEKYEFYTKMLIAIVTALLGIAGIVFNASQELGINTKELMAFVLFAAVLVAAAYALINIFFIFGSRKRHYENMVADLRELILLKNLDRVSEC